MMNDVPRLILDANIMASALIGRSFPLFERLAQQGVEMFAAEAQFVETRKTLSARSFATQEWVDLQLERLLSLVAPLPSVVFEEYEDRARARLHERGQSDWPVLAASIEMEAAIWSHDKDFFGSGAAVWSTFMLNRQLAAVD